MSADVQIEPPLYTYLTPDEGQPVYDNPLDPPLHPPQTPSKALPVYTAGGNTQAAGRKTGHEMFVIDDRDLGRHPGMTTCTHCQQQVMTNVTFKAGQFAWILCTTIIVLGLLMCLVPMLLLPIPFCVKSCKDAYHTCPRCERVLHIEKRQCCKQP
ncbi:lipopolysaccharide-induced tumor necrosis factor-alpha factor homolog [Plectropomus leopardus]|uniref:lipopolysaccharide-induced tumor necrosis factor-alpha factor homolog n=1 Tax=Plectropomus leopardus TaxID=160734 RepID=UPI001C4CEB19|nr:lipopolysaccharide-induced tumor necrosis factor-alpha factor homolog [Plectropomus leopardus]